MKNLISITDFVLETQWLTCGSPRVDTSDRLRAYNSIIDYANFLKQPLELWMFVPCDEYGNVLEEPKEYFDWYKWGDFSKYGKSITPKCKEYNQAKERCLFEGFYMEKAILFYKIEKYSDIEFPYLFYKDGLYQDSQDYAPIKVERFIEDICNTKAFEYLFNQGIELTPPTIKQLGL